MSHFQPRDSRFKKKASFDDRVSTGRLEAAIKLASRSTQEHECQLRAVESQISTTLSNFRAIESMMRDRYSGLEQHNASASMALQDQVPWIQTELEESEHSLTQLNDTLPDVDMQITEMRAMYNAGYKEAHKLVDDLIWFNTDFYERWRRIIFSDSPVPWRWKLIMRTVFTVLFMTCTVIFCIALAGAYRAHRHRLVWGDKLMS